MNQNNNRPGNILSDLAQMANGAASAFGSLRSEAEVIRASRADRQAAANGTVTVEDFEAAVTRMEALAARIAVLEAQMQQQTQTDAKPKRKTKRKSAPKT